MGHASGDAGPAEAFLILRSNYTRYSTIFLYLSIKLVYILVSKRRSHRLATMLTVLYIGDKLREARKRALLTQQELADKSGVGVTTIVRIERNQVEPHARTIRKLAAGLGVDPKELL